MKEAKSEWRTNLMAIGLALAILLTITALKMIWFPGAGYRDWQPKEMARYGKPVIACQQYELTEQQLLEHRDEMVRADWQQHFQHPDCQCLCPPNGRAGLLAWSDDNLTASCSC